MSSDIVERLREFDRYLGNVTFSVIRDAADAIEARDAEIERLRLRVEQLENGHDAWEIALPLITADLTAERAKVERLRTAGDAMAEAALRQQWSSLDVAVAAWQEVRK